MGKGPTMSIPHYANDQGLVIVLRASKGTRGMERLFDTSHIS